MAFFDIQKNRESWEQAMSELRAERERRLSGEAPGAVASARELSSRTLRAERIPITFQQVLDEYQIERTGKEAPAPSLEKQSPSREREASLEKQAPAPKREHAMEGPELLRHRPQG
jgi:hypothetical protein